MTDKIVVLCACGSAEEAEKVARALLDSRLAACVNMLPAVRSLYWWKGKVEDAAEHMLLIKSTRPVFKRLKAELARVHSYEVPEIIALSVEDGAESYLKWIDSETSQV